jgi:hypothetical protein
MQGQAFWQAECEYLLFSSYYEGQQISKEA